MLLLWRVAVLGVNGPSVAGVQPPLPLLVPSLPLLPVCTVLNVVSVIMLVGLMLLLFQVVVVFVMDAAAYCGASMMNQNMRVP